MAPFQIVPSYHEAGSAPSSTAQRVYAGIFACLMLLAIVVLIGTIWLLRKAAAKIFRIGMLIYGKEASFAEVSRWLLNS